MTLRSRRQPFRRPFSAPIFFFHSRRVHSRIHPIRRLWCTGRPFLLLHRRRVLDRFSETRDSLLRSRCLATRRSRRRRAANGRRRSPHRCRRRRRSSTPILLSRCSPLSRERGLLRRHHVMCSTRVDRDDNTREREREREMCALSRRRARDLLRLLLLRLRRRLPRRRRPFKAARFLERIIMHSPKRIQFSSFFPKPYKVYWFRVYSSFFFF